jgi:hypothetical protein
MMPGDLDPQQGDIQNINVNAQTGYGFAYGLKSVGSVRGNQAMTWTGQPWPNHEYSRSSLAICRSSDCLGEIVQTGWAMGTATGGQIKQYVVYRKTSGPAVTLYFDNVVLAQNRWYKFKVLYSNSAARWEAWLDNVPKWYRSDLGWTPGNTVKTGGEGKNPGSWATFNVWAYDLQYKVGSGNWTYYNYDTPLTWDACIAHAYTYGYYAWVDTGCVN